MNELQKRILVVLKNIGVPATAHTIRSRGNIAKPIDVMECNLRSLEKLKQVRQESRDRWSIISVEQREATYKKNRKKGSTKAAIKAILVEHPGIKQCDIARQLGVTEATVSQHTKEIRAKHEKELPHFPLPADPGDQVGALEDGMLQITQEGVVDEKQKRELMDEAEKVSYRLGLPEVTIPDLPDGEFKVTLLKRIASGLIPGLSDELNALGDWVNEVLKLTNVDSGD